MFGRLDWKAFFAGAQAVRARLLHPSACVWHTASWCSKDICVHRQHMDGPLLTHTTLHYTSPTPTRLLPPRCCCRLASSSLQCSWAAARGCRRLSARSCCRTTPSCRPSTMRCSRCVGGKVRVDGMVQQRWTTLLLGGCPSTTAPLPGSAVNSTHAHSACRACRLPLSVTHTCPACCLLLPGLHAPLTPGHACRSCCRRGRSSAPRRGGASPCTTASPTCCSTRTRCDVGGSACCEQICFSSFHSQPCNITLVNTASLIRHTHQATFCATGAEYNTAYDQHD